MTLHNSMIELKGYLIAKVTGALGKSFQMHKEIGLLGAMATQRKIVMPIVQVVLPELHIGAPSRKGLGGAMYVTA